MRMSVYGWIVHIPNRILDIPTVYTALFGGKLTVLGHFATVAPTIPWAVYELGHSGSSDFTTWCDPREWTQCHSICLLYPWYIFPGLSRTALLTPLLAVHGGEGV